MRTNKNWVPGIIGLALLLALLVAACAPAATPTPTPIPKVPASTAVPKSTAPAASTPAATTVATPAAQAKPAGAPVTVRFASPGLLSDAGVYIGIEKGFFKEQNVDVKIETVQSAADAIAPLASGDLDVAGGILSTGLLNAIDRGVAMKIVATKGGAEKGFDASAMIIRKDLIDSGKVKTVADLKGMTLAQANVHSASEAESAFFLKQGGLTIKDVNMVTMGYPDMITAFANKAIDMSIENEPLITTAVDKGVAVRWDPGEFSTIYGGEYQVATLQFSEAFDKNVDAARRFMIGYVKGLRAYNDAFAKGIDKDGIIAILAKYTAQKDPALYSKMQLSYLNPDGTIDAKSMQMDFDYLKQMGYYTGNTTLSSIIDTQYTDYAVQQLGSYK